MINATIGTKIHADSKGGTVDMCNAIEEMLNDAKDEGKLEGRLEGRLESRSEYSSAIRLIRQGVTTPEGLIQNGISEDTARMALEAMLDPV